jgi:hypothetical protein
MNDTHISVQQIHPQPDPDDGCNWRFAPKLGVGIAPAMCGNTPCDASVSSPVVPDASARRKIRATALLDPNSVLDLPSHSVRVSPDFIS